MPLMPRSASKSDNMALKLRRTSINSSDGDQTTKLLDTNTNTDDETVCANGDDDGSDTGGMGNELLPPSTPHTIPTIYPNDYDFDIEPNFKQKSTSRSFMRPAKTLSQEHRNRSVPHNLQVWTDFLLLIELEQRMKFGLARATTADGLVSDMRMSLSIRCAILNIH